MMKCKYILCCVLLLAVGSVAMAQKTSDKTNMINERNQIQQELREIQSTYNSVKGEAKEKLSQLAALNRKIDLQTQYINNIGKEIHLIDDDIYYSAVEISRLKNQLDTLKLHYARTVVYSYKNRSNYDYLNFLFSANSFNDAVKRIAYLKSYRNYRQQQMTDIVNTKNLIAKRYEQQMAGKQKKKTALDSRTNEITVLEQQKIEKDSVVTQLKSQAGDLQKQIALKQKRDRELKSSIAVVIRKEIADARKAAQEEARRKAAADAKARAEAMAREREKALANAKLKEITLPSVANVGTEPPSKSTTITPPSRINPEISTKTKNVSTGRNVPIVKANPVVVPTVAQRPPVVENKAPVGGYLNYKASDIASNTSFAQNKGRLPSPLDNGYISLGFGRYKIEGVGPDIVGDNPGITFSAAVGAPVKAVFDGEVASVSNVGGMAFIVLRHGKYFTAYSNLSSVNVAKGASVLRGQVIGHVGADEETGKGKLDFLLMIEERNVDPRPWLR
jgi:murein hydrolase activator